MHTWLWTDLFPCTSSSEVRSRDLLPVLPSGETNDVSVSESILHLERTVNRASRTWSLAFISATLIMVAVKNRLFVPPPFFFFFLRTMC